MNYLILLATIGFAIWAIKRDTAGRTGISRALWIPTLWVGILSSRPLSLWFHMGGNDTLEGSPLDRLFFFGLLVAALVVLSRRRVALGPLFARHWPIALFYLYLLITVLWANSPLASFKRWTKEVGNIAVVLVILSEVNPLQAIRAVFVRCAYVLIPLSIVYIRYFPDLGRSYSIHSGELQVIGVTTQKNSLGTMILVCGLVFIWDWLEKSRQGAALRSKADRLITLVLAGAAAWLIHLSDSKTSITCLAIGAAILAAVRIPFLHRRLSAMGIYSLVAVAVFFWLDSVFGFSRELIASLGRDMTFTGRTEVWRELLNVRTDPLFGAGFMSFWDDPQYRARLPEWVAFSAHNGYLEVYLAGGFIGVGFLGLMLLSTGLRINRALAGSDVYAVVRFAVFVTALVANYFESNFACMSPLGFLFLISAIGSVQPAHASAPVPAWGRDLPGHQEELAVENWLRGTRHTHDLR